MRIINISVLACTCMFHVACGSVKKETSQTSEMSRSSAPQVNIVSTDLLPLALGNQWTYRKVVPKGRSAFVRQMIPLKTSYVVSIGKGPRGPQTCTETYKIASPGDKSNKWQIDISAIPSHCGGFNLRDGRYERSKQIFWEKNPGDRHITSSADEIIVYDANKLYPGWRKDLSDNPTQMRTFVFNWEALANKGEIYKEYGLSLVGDRSASVSSFNKSISIKTSKGTFSDCVKVSDDVKLNEKGNMKDPFSTGWTTQRYFCNRIGLVKELQMNRAGEILYSMELIEYRLAQQ